MKKLLITGFAPFGGETTNPSWDAVCQLPAQIGTYELTKLRIPVVFGKAAETVIQAADMLCPAVILCIGQAGGRSAITPELVGINLRHASIPDNDGNQPQAPITEGGGLSSLRRKIEQEGGEMTVQATPVFRLIITLPKERGDIL